MFYAEFDCSKMMHRSHRWFLANDTDMQQQNRLQAPRKAAWQMQHEMSLIRAASAVLIRLKAISLRCNRSHGPQLLARSTPYNSAIIILSSVNDARWSRRYILHSSVDITRQRCSMRLQTPVAAGLDRARLTNYSIRWQIKPILPPRPSHRRWPDRRFAENAFRINAAPVHRAADAPWVGRPVPGRKGQGTGDPLETQQWPTRTGQGDPDRRSSWPANTAATQSVSSTTSSP